MIYLQNNGVKFPNSIPTGIYDLDARRRMACYVALEKIDLS